MQTSLRTSDYQQQQYYNYSTPNPATIGECLQAQDLHHLGHHIDQQVPRLHDVQHQLDFHDNTIQLFQSQQPVGDQLDDNNQFEQQQQHHELQHFVNLKQTVTEISSGDNELAKANTDGRLRDPLLYFESAVETMYSQSSVNQGNVSIDENQVALGSQVHSVEAAPKELFYQTAYPHQNIYYEPESHHLVNSHQSHNHFEDVQNVLINTVGEQTLNVDRSLISVHQRNQQPVDDCSESYSFSNAGLYIQNTQVASHDEQGNIIHPTNEGNQPIVLNHACYIPQDDNNTARHYPSQHLAGNCDSEQPVYRTLGVTLPLTCSSQPQIQQFQAHDYSQQNHPQQQQSESQNISSHQLQTTTPASSTLTYLDGNGITNSNDFYGLKSDSTGVSVSRSRESSFSSAASTTSEDSSISSTLIRDEKRAREANIPLTYWDIVNLSIDQFNDQLARHTLSESQLTLIKDIRRRGKNKVAAQTCRKRKMEQIYKLHHEVNKLADKRRSLGSECSRLVKEHGNLVKEYDKINTIIRFHMQQQQQLDSFE